jgi:hypothetical protein
VRVVLDVAASVGFGWLAGLGFLLVVVGLGYLIDRTFRS